MNAAELGQHLKKLPSSTTTASEHSYFALYEAYGTRPYEWGSDPDRQKANTKEEEKDLGLLNEGMRYRDLDTGTFLTRDPIGYADGPNVYCYVHCNPITKFDPWGLEVKAVEDPNDENHTIFSISASVVFDDPKLTEKNKNGDYVRQDKRDAYVQGIKDSLMAGFNGSKNGERWSLSEDNLKITEIDGSASDVKNENDHIIAVVSNEKFQEYTNNKGEGMAEDYGGGLVYINSSKTDYTKSGGLPGGAFATYEQNNLHVPAHEFVHAFGIVDWADRHPNLSWRERINSELTPNIVEQMRRNTSVSGAINNNLGARDNLKKKSARNQEALRSATKNFYKRKDDHEQVRRMNPY